MPRSPLSPQRVERIAELGAVEDFSIVARDFARRHPESSELAKREARKHFMAMRSHYIFEDPAFTADNVEDIYVAGEKAIDEEYAHMAAEKEAQDS